MLQRLEQSSIRYSMLLIISVCFFALRYTDAHLPFFWDELHAYVKGSLYMVDNGISLLPSSVPASISFGHPLLLTSITACWIKIFGITPLIVHSLSILICIVTAFGCYLLTHSITQNYLAAVLAFVIFLIQPVVVALSTQVVLEMLLTCNVVFAILFFIQQRFAYSVLFTVFAVLTKETGLVLALAFPVTLFVHFMINKDTDVLIKRTLLYAIPFVVFVAFLILQKQTHGWYLNPNNLNETKLELASITQRTWDYSLKFVWLSQGRFFLTVISIATLITHIIKLKGKSITPSNTTFILLIFSLGFMLFSSVASCLHRYFLVLIPIVSLTYATSIVKLISINSYLGIASVALSIGLSFAFMNNNLKNCEMDLSYRYQILANKELLVYLNQPKFKGKTIKMDFPIDEAAKDIRYGYTDMPIYKRLDFTSKKTADYIVYTFPGNLPAFRHDTSSLTLIKKIDVQAASAFLFANK